MSFALLALAAVSVESNIEVKLLPSGASKKTGGYRPIRANFTPETTVKKKPADLKSPKYGALAVGDKSYAFILDEPETGPARLFVDSNNDGDLTNDAAAVWEAKKQGESTMYFGSANLEIGKEVPVAINFYRFDPKDPQRAALKDTILYYFDYGYELTFELDGKKFTSFVAGEPSKDTSISVDRNGDGKISYKRENVKVGVPFNYTGSAYQLNFKDGLTLDKLDAKVEMTPLPPDTSIGKKAIPFTSKTLDGTEVKFPEDYKGKLVMLDFWATWCGPCIAELPNVKAAYAKWHDAGFDILGISFDQADKTDLVTKFTAENGMPWRHIYEGKYWDTRLGGEYDVAGIPFVLLVDGDTGEILADAKALRGPGITEFIGKALEKKKKLK